MPEIATQTYKPKKKASEAQMKAIKKYQQRMKEQGVKYNYNTQEGNRYNQYRFNTIKMVKYLFEEK